MSDELIGNSDELELKCKCVNCFRDVVGNYDYAMDMLLCRNCHNAYLDGNLDTDKLSFLKHGNWKIESLQAKLKELQKENARMREALEFYANEMNYSVDDYCGISGQMRTRCILYTDLEERNDVYRFAGRRARKALERGEWEFG